MYKLHLWQTVKRSSLLVFAKNIVGLILITHNYIYFTLYLHISYNFIQIALENDWIVATELSAELKYLA